MAIGIIIGGAFGKIVSSFVEDVIMPPMGVILGGFDFTQLTLTLKEATESQPAVVLRYGNFINNVVDFLIISLTIFLVIRQMNRLKKKEAEKPLELPAGPPEDIVLLREIRDSLKEKRRMKKET